MRPRATSTGTPGRNSGGTARRNRGGDAGIGGTTDAASFDEAERRWRQQLAASGPRNLADEIRPEGRAPRGQGAEYQARRWIANKLDQSRKKMNDHRDRLARSTGTAAGARRDTNASIRLEAQKRFYRDASAVVQAPTGDWTFKKELVDGIYQSTVGRLSYLG